MLAMRPNCERCDVDLPADSDAAMICSFECTFCRDCVDGPLHHTCPNCGGELRARPPRARTLWERHPPSTVRVHASSE